MWLGAYSVCKNQQYRVAISDFYSVSVHPLTMKTRPSRTDSSRQRKTGRFAIAAGSDTTPSETFLIYPMKLGPVLNVSIIEPVNKCILFISLFSFWWGEYLVAINVVVFYAAFGQLLHDCWQFECWDDDGKRRDLSRCYRNETGWSVVCVRD